MPKKGFTVYSIICPAYIFSPWYNDIIVKSKSAGVITARFAGEEKNSQALDSDMGSCCTFFKLKTLLIFLWMVNYGKHTYSIVEVANFEKHAKLPGHSPKKI